MPKNLQTVVLHCRINNNDKDRPIGIAKSIISIATSILERKPNADVFITGLLPRDKLPSIGRKHRISKQ